LDELNSIEPAATADAPSYQSIPIPPQMPQPEPAALHNQPYTIVANSVIGEIPARGVSGEKMPTIVSRGDALHACTMMVLFLNHVKGDGHVARANTSRRKE